MMRPPALAALALLILATGCKPSIPEPRQKGRLQGEAEPETVDVPQTVTKMAPGTTPMKDRVAVLGFLNKRNGISQELKLKPGQAVRIGDAVVRLRACETAAPWEIQQLTGAFVQLDVRNPQGQVGRVFSGWLYKETPSLNVVEHPIYDVWPKSCAMTHPGGTPPPERPASSASSRSSAPKSGEEPTAAPGGENAAAEPSAAESNAI